MSEEKKVDIDTLLEKESINTIIKENKEIKKPEKVKQKPVLKTLTMGEFLSTSREIKQKFNSYVIIGFRKDQDNKRISTSKYQHQRTYDDWMKVFLEYAQT